MRKKPFGQLRNPKWRLVVFHRSMNSFAVYMVLCALIGGAYGQQMYFVFALSAAGALSIARAWWQYLRGKQDGNDQPRFKIPDLLRREQKKKRHLPAFLRRNEEWQDDLVANTLPDEEILDDDERKAAQTAAHILTAILLFVLSFIVDSAHL